MGSNTTLPIMSGYDIYGDMANSLLGYETGENVASAASSDIETKEDAQLEASNHAPAKAVILMLLVLAGIRLFYEMIPTD